MAINKKTNTKLLYSVSENVNEYKHNEKVWIFLKNIENRTTIWFKKFTIGIIFFKRHKISTSKRYFRDHAYFNIRLSEAGTAQEDKTVLIHVRFLKGG